ncbi:PhzF family phenazine biosynthesis protein [Altericista sp. CCNU0014]|uniref:PhzF family phenazine biosynthesis protein n=1 Tax=Altericista sp. CCNU0014 TaxID=3082949 RepID=UPI00384F2BE4
MVLADNTLLVYWVDAFCDRPFCGNPAVVVPQADGLSEAQMQQIAREVNCSETAFVLQPTLPEADFRLRWFTPTQEVNLCGHATVAALHALAREGRFNLHPGVTEILYIETRSGVLKVLVDCKTDRPWIWLTLPECKFERIPADLARQLAAALGLPERSLSEPVADTLNRDVLVSVPHLHQLQSLTPDMAALTHLGKERGWRGFGVFTRETVEPDRDVHVRFFAPQSGILEDPVTGSVSGPIALLLRQSGESKDPERDLWRFEQGDGLNRAGRLLVELHGETPKLGGQAVTVLRGELYL